jgi:hypothetical protein
MGSCELGKYFDERGRKVLIHEAELGQLGLIVEKKLFGRLQPVVSGGVLDLYDLQFKKTSDKFSTELVEFLRNTINLLPDDIERLQQQAVFSPES